MSTGDIASIRARGEEIAPSLSNAAERHLRDAAQQVSDKLGTMARGDNLRITARGARSLLPLQAAEAVVGTSLIDRRKDHPE